MPRNDPHLLRPALPSERPWAAPLALAALALAACTAIAVSDRAADLVPDCPFRAATGQDCPLCGGTRAVRALAGGRPLDACGHNLLVVAALPLVGYAWAVWAAGSVGIALPRLRAPRWAWPLAVALVLAFTVARNLPVAGLGWLGSGG